MTTAERFYANNEMVNTPPIDCDLKIGDSVIFTNDYGIQFGPYNIVGFTKPKDICYGRFIHINDDSPWFPVKREDLAKVEVTSNEVA